jgi:SP family sugar:H+ symporter-like MFS transporter
MASFGLNAKSKDYADLTGWIVTVLQAGESPVHRSENSPRYSPSPPGCFFGAMSAAVISDRLGRKKALFIAAFFFFLGSILQTVPALNGQGSKSSLNQASRVV